MAVPPPVADSSWITDKQEVEAVISRSRALIVRVADHPSGMTFCGSYIAVFQAISDLCGEANPLRKLGQLRSLRLAP